MCFHLISEPLYTMPSWALWSFILLSVQHPGYRGRHTFQVTDGDEMPPKLLAQFSTHVKLPSLLGDFPPGVDEWYQAPCPVHPSMMH